MSFAQTTSATPEPPLITLIVAENGDPLSQRLAKHVAAGLTRRGQALVPESDASSRLGRPVATAMLDCTGDDLCFNALGQVVRATQVLVVSTAASKKEELKYECFFRVIDIRTGKTRGPMVVTVIASEAGLLTAANTVAENVAPRPRIAAVATPTPVVPAPTPTLAVPEPTPSPVAVDPVPEDEPEAPAAPATRRRRALLRDPAFWAVAGAGMIAIGAGAFLGAAALEPEEPEDRSRSTVEVRF